MAKRGYAIVQDKKTLMVITLSNGEIIKKELTHNQVRDIIKTNKVISVQRGE